MKIRITGKYLVLPVNNNSVPKQLRFFEQGQLVFDFNAKVDPVHPEYHSYTDVGRFLGREFECKVEPDSMFACHFSDLLPETEYTEPYRPRVHFSARQGWINDPNGLIYLDGVYHLYFQYNPSGNQWGNMTWGHAVSTDLIRWEEKEPVLFPDDLGTMYSGSAILDEKNKSGLGKDGKRPILYFYTAAGGENALSAGKLYTQCLAYSLDGGQTLVKYGDNPVIENHAPGNRDPKVNWCEELDRYIMPLYYIGERFAIYASDDLLHWEKLQEFHFSGDGECPDCYPLTTPEGERKWIFSAAHGRYCIGSFENGLFRKESEERAYNYGNGSYAAQIFSGTGDRKIKLEWGTVTMPGEVFASQTGLPRDMSLCRDTAGTLRLKSDFSKETFDLASDTIRISDLVLTDTEAYRTDLPLGACYTEIKAPLEGKGLTVTIFGVTLDLDYEAGKARLRGEEAPLTMGGPAVLDLKMVTDAAGTEILLDDGRIFFSARSLWDASMSYLQVRSKAGDSRIEKLRISPLKNIWEKQS